jgi:hypothetical protein
MLKDEWKSYLHMAAKHLSKVSIWLTYVHPENKHEHDNNTTLDTIHAAD